MAQATSRSNRKPETAAVSGAPTFRDEIDRWVSSKRAAGKKPATLVAFAKSMHGFADWAADQGAPVTSALDMSGSAGRPYVVGYMSHLRDVRHLAEGSIKVFHSTARNFWAWMIDVSEEGDVPPHVKRSPLKGVAAPTATRGDQVGVPYSEEEIDRILAAAGDPRTRNIWRRRDRAVIRVLAGSGLRRQEVARLTVGDYSDGKIIVQRSAGKASSPNPFRTTAIYNSSRDECNAYIALLRYAGLGDDDAPLFPSERAAANGQGKRAMNSEGISGLVWRLIHDVRHGCTNAAKTPATERPAHCERCTDGDLACKGCAACVVNGGVHRFRHTGAIDALRRGVPESLILKRFGWKDVAMLSLYTERAAGELAQEAFAEKFEH